MDESRKNTREWNFWAMINGSLASFYSIYVLYFVINPHNQHDGLLQQICFYNYILIKQFQISLIIYCVYIPIIWEVGINQEIWLIMVRKEMMDLESTIEIKEWKK